jgi:CRISPR-associated protein Cmr5
MTEVKIADGGKKIEPLPSIVKAKKVMELMKPLQLEKETVNFLKGMPSMIMQNGLGQTIAFMICKAKEKEKENKNYVDILKVLKALIAEELMAHIVGLDPKRYIQLQREVIEYAGWMKKFAIAFHAEPQQ